MASTIFPPLPVYDLPAGMVATILPGAFYHARGTLVATKWGGPREPVVVVGPDAGRWHVCLCPRTGETLYVRADGLMISQHET